MPYPVIPPRFRRNQVKNLCRRKGYRLVRFYSTFYHQWHYRTEPLKYLRGVPGDRRGLEYCDTHIKAIQRVYAHMLGKPDVAELRARKASKADIS